MPLEHELELVFPTAQVTEPIICEMGRAVDVMFSIHRASISHQQGRMLVKLTGEPDQVRKAEVFLRDRRVEVSQVAEHLVDGPLADIPRAEPAAHTEPTIARKLWLTLNLDAIEKPILWELQRRFDVVFDVRQSSIGREVGVVGLLLKGPRNAVDSACAFLAGEGIEVEPIEKSVVES